ncbi:MAG: hypothetical protein UU48_C0014G0015 [Candidatus Uhrbacteria bacterium GW2011_GWF2_41_16]|jgi:hypothetical protein|uniref:Uncharacterized protein n=2 Tax=Candidatus Uhriibacteriota TaxID=1752732 RepID=A0A0G0YAZ3_9BACT|nr:MAG: hypothetical protein UU31_C0014G0006 [Candidatus Uhrbacteria bacterium GW2011_GWA2_41_10]KKR86664.1 MAG: hypothetical protein UU35_C0010G0042 [Candidatus Uhrbacteria bacterium GW2011_GWC2_41_11]KKR97482.1 MAG: hypothetical protein UU48_C0014G0015 [Candidatus Uhrbacteria bacterium GW2011_GWF2_41_16]HBP00147.1 hypothetical protein [Candidatus Uhrbacteria bacterium]
MRIKRLLFFWFAGFALVYVTNILAVTAWTLFSYNNIFLMIGMMNAPLIYLLFGWLYFRGGFAAQVSDRLKVAIVWIMLDFLGGMALLAILDGVSPSDMFTTASYLIETVNFFAILVAGYVALKRKTIISE